MLPLGLSLSNFFCLCYALLLEIRLVQEAFWAQGVVKCEDEVMRREAEHFTLVVGFPRREVSGKFHDVVDLFTHISHLLEELHGKL